jgi:hypothetical protein
MAQVLLWPGWQVFDSNGDPAAGAKAFFYDAGTSTPKTVYSDSTLTTPYSQPVLANATGHFTETGPIYGAAGDYKLKVTDSTGGVGLPGVDLFPEVDNWTVLANLTQTILSFPTVTKTTNYEVVAGDRGKVLEFDAAGATLIVTLKAATLGSGFPIWIVNSGTTGTIQLQFDGAETLLDAATYDLVNKHQVVGITSRGAAGWRIIAAYGFNFDTLVTFNAGLTVTAGDPATFGGPVIFPPVTLTDAGTIAWDLATGTNFQVTLGANRILGAFTNGTDGQKGTLRVIQDGAGGRTLDLTNAVYDFSGAQIDLISTGIGEVTEYNWERISAAAMRLERKWMSGRSSMGFWKEYDKGALAVSTVYTQAHGLGRNPAHIAVFYENTTTDAGWIAAPADRLLTATGALNDSALSAGTVAMNTTNVIYVNGPGRPRANNKTTGAAADLVTANWKVILRIYE